MGHLNKYEGSVHDILQMERRTVEVRKNLNRLLLQIPKGISFSKNEKIKKRGNIIPVFVLRV